MTSLLAGWSLLLLFSLDDLVPIQPRDQNLHPFGGLILILVSGPFISPLRAFVTLQGDGNERKLNRDEGARGIVEGRNRIQSAPPLSPATPMKCPVRSKATQHGPRVAKLRVSLSPRPTNLGFPSYNFPSG